jgi:ketosteroid isomerase-like protein
MKRALKPTAIIATAAILLGAWSLRSEAAGSAKQQITDLEHKCATIDNVDELMKTCYDPSDDLVVYDITPPAKFAGQKAVHDDFAGFFSNVKNPKVEFVELNVITDGKLGVANSIQHLTGTDKDGKPVDLTFRVTDTLHKVDGSWKIVREHISVPVDLATNKAVLNSKP